jgi:hypothetical protein
MSTTYMVPLKGGEIYPSHVLLLLPQLFLELGLFWFLCAGTVLKLDGVKLLLGALELCIYKVRQYPAIWGKSHLHRHPRWGYVPFLQVLPHRPPICVLPSSAPRPPSSWVPNLIPHRPHSILHHQHHHLVHSRAILLVLEHVHRLCDAQPPR